jgi:hypothetical protein
VSCWRRSVMVSLQGLGFLGQSSSRQQQPQQTHPSIHPNRKCILFSLHPLTFLCLFCP